MSGNIFGDDEDEFELTPGGDDAVSPAKKSPSQQSRPAPQQTRKPAPARPNAPSTGAGSLPSSLGNKPRRETSNDPTPTVKPSSASNTTPRTSSLPVKPSRRSTTSPTPSAVPSSNNNSAMYEEEVEDVKLPEPIDETVQGYEEPEQVDYEEINRSARSESRYAHRDPVIEQDEYEYAHAKEDYRQPKWDTDWDEPEEPKPVASPKRSTRSSAYDDDNDFMNERFNSRQGFKNSFDDDYDDDSDYDDEEEEEQPPPRKRQTRQQGKKGNSKKKPATTSKRKASKKKKPKKQNFAGGRSSVLIIRLLAGGFVLFLVGMGVNSIVNPPTIPSPADVQQVVREDLNMLGFPKDKATAFVSAFTREYLTVDPDNTFNETDALSKYISEDQAFDLTLSNDQQSEQNVTGGPIVTNIVAKDESNAVYTVAAEINSSSWIYLDIPVFYKESTGGMSISGTPAFVAPPTRATVPVQAVPYDNDDDLANEITPMVTSFFRAWAASDAEQLDRYLPNTQPHLPDLETTKGLQGSVEFVELVELSIEEKDPQQDAATFNTRRGQATVKWQSPTDEDIIYTQLYNLTFFRDATTKTWYVEDINGGIRGSQ